MKKLLFVPLFTVLFISLVWSQTLSNLWSQIWNLEEQGEYSKVTSLIQNYLNHPSEKLSSVDRRALEFEIDRLTRVRRDYRTTEDELFNTLQKDIPDLTISEFNQMEAKGYFDIKWIDGEKRYFNSSRSNLYMRYAEYRKRRINQDTKNTEADIHWQAYEKIKSEGENSKTGYVNPQKYHMVMTITVNPDAVPDGKIVKCWMPYPRKMYIQKDIKYISSEPAKHILASETAPMRSIYLEKKAKKGEPTEFKVEYEYTCYSRWQLLDPKKIKPYNKQSAEYKKFTEERPPHIVFSKNIKELSEKIVGNEKNPCIIAKKIFDWIGDYTQYSYAPEYSTIPNISAFCSENRYGDCGIHALLFMTLCRYNGIPARWQSGWSLMPKSENLHDWSEIYLEPYGWVPVDPDMAVWSHRWAEALGEDKGKLLKDFYFGNIDNFRLIANGDHGRNFTPPKKAFRSDTVDFQRGELECDGKNIYYDKFNYKLDVNRL